MKQTIALILFAILAAGCATQPPKPDPATNLVAEVEQSKDGELVRCQQRMRGLSVGARVSTARRETTAQSEWF